MTIEPQKNVPIKPQFAGAVYFALFALLFLLFAKYTLLSLSSHNNLLLPLFPSILIALITGGFIGSFFGPLLARENRYWCLLLIGALLAIIAIFLVSLAILLHACLYDATFFSHLRRWQDYFVIYGALLLSLTFIVGLWLIPLMSLATLYFNKRFLPRLLAANKQQQNL